MQTIDISQDEAVAALMLLGWHVEPGVEVGRPQIAQRDGASVVITTPVGWWWVTEDAVERLLPLGGDWAEQTDYRSGSEVSRTVVGAGDGRGRQLQLDDGPR